jgi:hypothetical protein
MDYGGTDMDDNDTDEDDDEDDNVGANKPPTVNEFPIMDETANMIPSAYPNSYANFNKMPPTRRKTARPQGLYGPDWFMDYVAKGATVEETREALGMTPLPITPGTTDTPSTDTPSTTEAPSAPRAKRPSSEEVEFRRGICELNREAMKAVAAPDGYVDPLRVAQYLMARSGVDRPPGARPYRKTSAEEFVEEMSKKSLDVRELYATILADQEEEERRAARRRVLKRTFMPKAQKDELRAEEARQAAEKRVLEVRGWEDWRG